MSDLKIFRVVHVLELESFIEAEDENEALMLAREGLVGLEDGGVIVEERADVWSEPESEDAL